MSSFDRDALINSSADDVLTVALTIGDAIQGFEQHLRLAGAMLFLQTCAELTGTSPQDVAMVAGNIRTAAQKGLVDPGKRHKALVEFLKDDVMQWREELAEEEGIDLA